MSRFELERFYLWLFRASPWLFGGLALLAALLPFFPDDRPTDTLAMAVFSITCSLIFGSLTWYSVRMVRRLHLAAVTLDDEGIWPTTLPRSSSLVRWTDVSRLRERPTMQRLELLSASGALLLRLEYQLSDFETLRAQVLARARLDSGSLQTADGIYSMPRTHHVVSVGGALGFAMLGWYVGETAPWLGYGGMSVVVAVVVWEYWTLPYRIELTAHTLELDYPGRHRSIARGFITDIRVADDHDKQMRRPFVLINVEGSKPVQLKGFRLQPVELFQVLKAWRSGTS